MVKILLFGVYVGVPVAVWTNKNLRFRAFWLRVQGLRVLVCVSSLGFRAQRLSSLLDSAAGRWGFPKIRGTLFGILIVRILLFRLLFRVPYFRKLPGIGSTLRRHSAVFPPPAAKS